MATKRTRIKFYAHLIFQNHDVSMGDMFRSIDIVVKTVSSVCEIFKGEAKYHGDGSESVQYDDVVEFDNLSDIHKETILRIYPFARTISS